MINKNKEYLFDYIYNIYDRNLTMWSKCANSSDRIITKCHKVDTTGIILRHFVSNHINQ